MNVKDFPISGYFNRLSNKLWTGATLSCENRLAILSHYGNSFSPSTEMFILLEDGKKKSMALSARVFRQYRFPEGVDPVARRGVIIQLNTIKQKEKDNESLGYRLQVHSLSVL